MSEDKDNNTKLLNTFLIHETNLADVKVISRLLKGYKHIENILNILLRNEFDKAKASTVDDLDSKAEVWKIFNLLKNPVIMKAVLNQNKGGEKTSSNIQLVNHTFQNNQLFQQMIKSSTTPDFNDKNLSMMVRRLSSAWSNYFVNLKQYFLNPSSFTGRPSYPKAKKLVKLTEFSLALEPSKFSFKTSKVTDDSGKAIIKKNKMRLSIGSIQKIVHFGQDNDYVASKQINNVTVCYSHGHIYYAFSYLVGTITKAEKEALKKKEKQEALLLKHQAPVKVAGLDIGMYNLLSLYVNDKETQSLIVSGKELISYNSNFNKRIAKIATELTSNVASYEDVVRSVTDDEGQVSTKTYKVPKEYNALGKKLVNRRSQIFERRRLYQEDYLQKVSKKIVQYLVKSGVDRLVISKNLSFAKQAGEIKMQSKTKQKFYQLSFGRLLNLIEYKAKAAKIDVKTINEAYTSKTSSLSADVNAVVKKVNESGKESLVPTDFNGSRGTKKKGKLNNPLGRGLFKDKVLEKVVNADLNAAANHVKVGYPNISINCDLWKYCNPIKTRTSHELTEVIKSKSKDESSKQKLAR